MIEDKGPSVAVRNNCDNDFKLNAICQFCVNNSVILLYELSIEELIMLFYSCFEFLRNFL